MTRGRRSISRETTETQIADADRRSTGSGRYTVSTGIRFFDHMLELLARHGAFDLTDPMRPATSTSTSTTRSRTSASHSARQAVTQALGSKRGINRAGYFVMPMDETLGVAAVDLSGRVHAVTDLNLRRRAASAICRRSWCTTSSTASRRGRAPTCT